MCNDGQYMAFMRSNAKSISPIVTSLSSCYDV
jgi:hypothetical protein